MTDSGDIWNDQARPIIFQNEDIALPRRRRSTLTPDLVAPETEACERSQPQGVDPGLDCLGLTAQRRDSNPSIGESVDLDVIMSGPVPPDSAQFGETSTEMEQQELQEPSSALAEPDSTESADESLATAALARMRESDASNHTQSRDLKASPPATTTDPKHPSEAMEHHFDIRTSQSDSRKLPLSLHPSPAAAPPEESLTTSPTIGRYVRRFDNQAAQLPAFQQPTSTQLDDSPNRGRAGSLPSFRRAFANLVDAASQQAIQPDVHAQANGRHHSQSFSSTTSPSPMLPPFAPTHPNSSHTSPVGHYHFSGRSPASTISDGPHYGSPHIHASQAHYADRSVAGQPHNAPSLPSTSSSGESVGNASADGYSTSHTTPTDSAGPNEGSSRALLPPLNRMPVQIFTCDFKGCTAAPFTTQYLLTSHKTVHSQNRPHYCPVKGCRRAEGGRGFKRKNEMKRHGLVHESPGYVCPFCPDREHRYPRPDNLQRHVRFHHEDKDKDDPQLREVLEQRAEGVAQKQRRRRTLVHGSVAPPPPPNTGES